MMPPVGVTCQAKSAAPSTKYRLQSVLVHEGGSPRSGHYFAFVRGSGSTSACSKWFRVDDAFVTETSWSNVATQQAYMVSQLPQLRCHGVLWALNTSSALIDCRAVA